MAYRHSRIAELTKRHYLREDLQHELSKPLADEPLSHEERKEIALRVRTGIVRQSVWPGAGGSKRVFGAA